MSKKINIICIGGGSDLHGQARLALRELGPIRELPGGRDHSRREIGDADLVVVTAPTERADRELGSWLRERTDAALLLLTPAGEASGFRDTGFDDSAPEDCTEEVRARAALLLDFRAAWRRSHELALDPAVVREDLTRFVTDPGLLDERGILPPGRVALQSLVNVKGAIRQQMAVCRLMGTSYGTFLYTEEPRGLPGTEGHETEPMGALSPYCAYLAGKGEHCLRSEHQTAREALASGQPIERECAGGLMLFAVPVVLRFAGLEWPLFAATVAVKGTATPEAIQRAAEQSGANPDILSPLMEESRFWVLNEDKVDGIRSTLKNLAETVSREVSHKYGTAYQLFHRAMDVKEIRHSRELLAESHKALETTNRSLRLKNEEIFEVTQAITHDLRKPLASLKAMISLLAKGSLGDLNDSQREAVDTASEANDYMMNLVGDLLEAARLETGRKLMELEQVLLPPLVERVRRRFKYQIEAAGIRFSVENLPESIWCDEAALEKVFMNLIGNSISYIGDGTKKITVRGRMDHETLVIEVADTGLGIPETSLSRVFEKFHRGQNVLDTRGTGLGLGIVKAIVVAHGGEMEIESREAEGTRVSFSLPHKAHVDTGTYSANPALPGRSIGG